MIGRSRAALLLLLGLAIGWQAPKAAEIPPVVTACVGAPEFPPFTYFQRVGGQASDQLVGYSIDTMREMLALGGRTVRIDYLPWKRCLLNGTLGTVDLVVDGFKVESRDSDFIFPNHPLSLGTPAFVFGRARESLEPGTPERLLQARLCGLRGWNFSPFGLAEDAVPTRAPDADAAIQLVRAGRCDAFLYLREAVDGLPLIGGTDAGHDPSLGLAPVAGVPAIRTYLLIGRKLPYGAELKTLVDQAAESLDASGERARIASRYHVAYAE